MNCCNSCFGVVFLYSLFLSLLVRTAASEASASELASSRLVGKDSKEKKKKKNHEQLVGQIENRHWGEVACSGPTSHGSPGCS